jgi:chromosome segregation ATPase
MEVREVPTADALLRDVREGVEEIARAALEEADRLREEADDLLQQYDAATSELASLRVEVHGLRHDIQELPQRVQIASLDALVPDEAGEDHDALQARYVAARERLPVAEARLSRLDVELASITSGGSRPSKVSNQGGERRLVRHNSREIIVDTLNETAKELERLRIQLPDVVKKATADLLKRRDGLRNDQNMLWGQSKA